MSVRESNEITLRTAMPKGSTVEEVKRELPHRAVVTFEAYRPRRIDIEVGSNSIHTLIGLSFLRGSITLQAAHNLHEVLGAALARIDQ